MNFALNQEQQMFREMVHDFAAKEVVPLAKHTDESSEFNWTAVRKMGALGLLGMQVPEEYGGAAMDTICAAIAIEELGWACGSTALVISAHNNLGIGPLLDTIRQRAGNLRQTHRPALGDSIYARRRGHRDTSGATYDILGGMAKLMATEMSERVCRNAIQVHGG